MVEILLSLGGVVIGGVIGLGGTYIQARNQKNIRRREEILPVASRALTESQEAWTMLRGHAIMAGRTIETGATGQKSGAGLTEDAYLFRYTEAKQRLQLSLDELSLLIKGVEDESQQLLGSVGLGTLPPGRQHYKQAQAYEDARAAFQRRIRDFLGT